MRARFIAVTLLLGGCAHQRQPAETTAIVPPAAVATVPADVPAQERPPVPERPSEYFVQIGPREDGLSAKARQILDQAATAYAERDVNVVLGAIHDIIGDGGFGGGGGEISRPEAMRRIELVRSYLRKEKAVWSQPAVRDRKGNVVPWSADSEVPGGTVILVLGPPPPVPMIPLPTPPEPDQPPVGEGPFPSPRPPRADFAAASRQGGPGAPAESAAPAAPSLASVRTWLTPTQTLTRSALQAMMGECARVADAVGAECGAAAAGGEGGFGAVPEEARREFAYLMRSCRGGMAEGDCIRSAGKEQEFRAFSRAELKPEPLEMLEGERTRFKAPLVDSGVSRGAAGRAIDARDAAGPVAPGAATPIIVPYSAEMCFTLDAEPGDFTIEPPARVCMKQQQTGSETVYRPEWWLTPLRSGKLGLRLKTELFVDGEKREFQHNPYPLPIDVKAKPSLLDGFDALVERLTRSVKGTTGLAEALGALFAAVSGWGIWALLRKRKARKSGGRPKSRRSKATGDSA